MFLVIMFKYSKILMLILILWGGGLNVYYRFFMDKKEILNYRFYMKINFFFLDNYVL